MGVRLAEWMSQVETPSGKNFGALKTQFRKKKFQENSLSFL